MPTSTMMQDHTSIPLIYLNSQTQPKFILNPKAIQLIQSYNNKTNNQTTFISICGDYRSGKSFLMNSLFFSKQGFKVSPTTQPCTKGINLWSKPITNNGKNIWILDTEGFGAIDRDDSYDVKIFLLTTLISDIVMYNSFGALDQNTINKFATICHKAESLDKGMKKIKMFWILRDFSLSIENKQGRVLSADEYLQSALMDETLPSQINSDRHNLYSQRQSLIHTQRQAIKRVFGQRHCIPLVRPVIDETILSQLSQIRFQQLRGQFVQQVYKLRKQLLQSVSSKVIQGVKVDSGNLSVFLNKYIQVLNMNEVETDVSSTWERVVEYEKQKQQGKLRLKIREILNKQTQKIPFNTQSLMKLIQQSNKLIEQHILQYQNHFTDKLYTQKTLQSIYTYISQTRSLLVTKNMQYLRNQQKKCVKGIFQSVQKQIGKQTKIDDAQLIQKYIEKLFKTKEQYVGKYGQYIEKNDKVVKSFYQRLQKSNKDNHKNNNMNKLTLSMQRQSLTRVNQLITQSSLLIYFEHFFHQQKVMFPKIVGQLSEQLALTMGKMNQMRKLSRSKQIDVKTLREQNQKLSQQIAQLNRQLSKFYSNKMQLTRQLQLKHHQVSIIATKSENDFIRIKSQYQSNIQQLKQTILNMEKDFMTVKKQNQLFLLQHQDKLNLINQKNQLLNNKLQQSKVNNQKTIQKIKQQYQQKIKKQQQKYTQLQNSLNQQRKKFLQLNKTKKQQQSQMLQDLAQKNQKLLSLRREMTNVEHIYKQQLQAIVNEQKVILQKQFGMILQQKQHLVHVLQQKLQQCIIRIQQLQQIQKRYQTLLMQHRLLSQQHLNVIDKYKQIVNKLKKTTKNQQQKDNFFQQIKDKYENELNSQEQLLKKFKLEIKTMQEQHVNKLGQVSQKHSQQINSIKHNEQQLYEQKLKQRISNLQATHKQQKQQILQQLKQSYNEIQTVKSCKVRLQTQLRQVISIIVRVRRQFVVSDKQRRGILRKYKKIQKESQLLLVKNNNKEQNEQNSNVVVKNNNKKQNEQNNNVFVIGSQSYQLNKIQENVSEMMQNSSIMQQSGYLQNNSNYQQQSLQQYQQQQYQQLLLSITKSNISISHQILFQFQSQCLQMLHSTKSLTQQLQDLKHSFKQTITQLEQCQSHITKLNANINNQQQHILKLSNSLSQLQQTKKQLQQKTIKLQSLQKSSQLLKKQIQLRDQIYLKRQSSIKQNLLLYKQTILNLTQQNQLLTEKTTKLQIELNRFTQWQADFTLNHYNNNNRSNIGSFQSMGDNNNMMEYYQTEEHIQTFSDKIHKLQKQNRKLKKQLNQQKELLLINNNNTKQSSSLTNILTTNTSNNNNDNNIIINSQIQSIKKQNVMYKKRVQQLRQRELKLLQQIKTIKINQKQSAENKLNLVRQQFESYRRKSKEQIVQLQHRIDQLTEQKYKLKQQILVMKQQDRGYVYMQNNNTDKKTINSSSGENNNTKGETMYNSNTNNNNDNNPDKSNDFTNNNNKSRLYISPAQQQSIIQSYITTIQTLKQQNTKLHLQITTLNTQLIKQKDQADKKLASLQIFYQQQIRIVQNQKSRIDLQNQKNKTKYQHLLKVNNQLIMEVDNFKAKANNQLTLKEKYKHKISALFTDDD